MATSTTNYSFTLPEVGGDTDQWGVQLNNNWTLADSTIKTIEDSVVDVTLTGNDYLTISGQAITVGNVDLTTDVTGTLPVGSGGTGLAAIGSANQVLGVNSGGTALEYKTLSTGGTVTSVAVTGSDGIEIDSGSPISSSGTIALGINSTTLSTHLGLGSLATQSTITESQISDLQSYLTAEVNDLSTAVTWANVPDANITQSSVTQHEAALSITESQISDLQSYLTAEANDLSSSVTWANVPDANITESSVTQHQAALSITESQISDFGSYQPSDAGLTSIAGLTTAADKMLYTTASDVYAVADLTAAGRAILDDADSTAQRTTLGLGALATQDTITESQISDLQSYLTAEVNDLSAAVTWANVPDANITQSSVTQHQSALSITESQISDLGSYQISDAGLTSIAGLTTAADKMIYTTAADTYAVTTLTSAGRALLDDADAAAQRTTLGLGSLATQSTITESQISDLQGYLTAETNDLGTAVTGTLGIGNGGTGLTALGSAGQVLTVNSGANALEYQTPLVALPITDSAGNNVLSESGSLVTLSADAAIIEGSSSGDLVRITQTGTGNALVVEDSTNPDSTPFVIDASGNVGIGTDSLDQTLVVKTANGGGIGYENSAGKQWRWAVGSSSEFAVIESGVAERLRIDSSGALILAGSTAQKATGTSWSNPSDQRLKSNISDYPKGTAELMQVRVREWEYNGKGETVAGTKGLGVIADEIMTVLPNTVDNYEAKLNVDDEETTQIKKFDATEITWLLVKTTQEQQSLIESQQSQIDALTARIEALENT